MKVSVLVMTYNHASFIAMALDSVLMQIVDFPYEILISEDNSTDGTREIILQYYQKYPDNIRLLLSKQNLRSNAIVVRGIQAAQGQYIALLDGDDYWTSPYKLKKQVRFLEEHPECAICFHNARVVHDDGSREPWNWTPDSQRQISTLEDIWMGNFGATCSCMFRNGLIGEFPEWYYSLFPITDWPLHILNAEHGKVGYINEVMGIYRYHDGGLYSKLSESQKLEETARFYETMNSNTNFRYERVIDAAIFSYFLGWAKEYARRGALNEAKDCFKKCLTGRPHSKLTLYIESFTMWLRLYARRAEQFRSFLN